MRTSTIRTVRRVIAVTLTLLFTLALTGSGFAAAATDTGGDFGVCGDGLWLKADWNDDTQAWDWEAGPDWDGDTPTSPELTITSSDDGDPMTVDWTSDTSVKSAHTKASTQHAAFDGGNAGTVSGIDGHAISHIVFCYGPEPPPAPTGSLTVVKEVVGEYDGSDEFAFVGTCQLPQFPAHAQFTLADGDSWTFPEAIPGYLDGSPCTFEETDANGADSTTYRLGDTELTPDADGTVQFALASTEDLVLTVTNTFEPPPAPTGSLTVVKEVVGEYDGGDEFAFVGTCQLPQFPAHAQFTLADGDSWTFPEAIPGYLDGSPCTFEETDANGADSTTYRLGDTELTPDADGTVQFALSSTEDLVLTVTNTFEPEPPEVRLEKAWFADADDTSPAAIFRKVGDEWMRVDDGDPFTQPEGFDLAVEYGPDTYTVTETLPEGWEAMTCSADAPQPNGLGTFPYERPGDARGDVEFARGDIQVARFEVRQEVVRHVVCNAPVPEPVLVPAVELVKTPDVDTITYAPDDGDDETVTYTYLVTNTGETPLTGLVLVDDVLGTITLADTELDPGESTTGTATHVVTAADADAGEIVNEAEVTGTAPDQTEVTATDDATVLVEQVLDEVEANPEVSLTKSALVTPEDGVKTVTWSDSDPDGTPVSYEYVITNTGETALTGLTLVDDVLGTITLPDTDLDVGETLTVTATHTVTQAEAEAGLVTNVATVTGTDPDGTEVSDTATETVFVTEVLGITEEQDPQPAVLTQDEELPATGAPAAALSMVALLSLAAGASLLRGTRRRTAPGRP